jgi:hypothetical protein
MFILKICQMNQRCQFVSLSNLSNLSNWLSTCQICQICQICQLYLSNLSICHVLCQFVKLKNLDWVSKWRSRPKTKTIFYIFCIFCLHLYIILQLLFRKEFPSFYFLNCRLSSWQIGKFDKSKSCQICQFVKLNTLIFFQCLWWHKICAFVNAKWNWILIFTEFFLSEITFI